MPWEFEDSLRELNSDIPIFEAILEGGPMLRTNFRLYFLRVWLHQMG